MFRPIIPDKAFPAGGNALEHRAAQLGAGRLKLFGDQLYDVGAPPRWLENVFTHQEARADVQWWKLSDFDPAQGDIKGIWEMSRFDWVVMLARAAASSHASANIDGINRWISDWIKTNPPYQGPNWRCGQETSIRLMHVLLAARLLEQDRNPEPSLVAFARVHLERIAPTVFYADAQDNNHATSEALALFAGGAWLASVTAGDVRSQSLKWSEVGRKGLERAARRLIFDDGGFSQFSVNYHRVMLDTLCETEMWRRQLSLPKFSPLFRERAAAAVRWLGAVVNAETGDAPNLGANDGARVFACDDLPFRDHRASVQLAATLFCGRSAYAPGPWDEPLEWFGLPRYEMDPSLSSKRSSIFPDTGLALLNPRDDGSGGYAFVKVPRATFRPGQCDQLHFDLWSDDGRCLLGDAGSYSYFETESVAWFNGTAAHNTVQFDDREPMRRISRFLFADWIDGTIGEAQRVSDGVIRWIGKYKDAFGVVHSRSVTADRDTWIVADSVSGFARSAVLRWRFSSDAVSTQVTIDDVEGTRSIDMPVAPSYMVQRPTNGLEARFGTLTTTIRTTIRVA